MIVQNLIEELEDEIRMLKDRCEELESEVELLQANLVDEIDSVSKSIDDETDNLWTIIHRIGNVLDLDPKLFDLKEPYWIMVVHFYEGQSYSWNYANRTYDDSGCWEDYLSADEYEDRLDRKRFEQSNRDW